MEISIKSDEQIRKLNTLTRKFRSARSDKSNNTKKIVPPIIKLNGKYKNTDITVYGEIHNMIDNRFYESLNLENNIIMVEHATVLCEMSEKDKRSMLNIVKGSDWIWYKYKSRNKPIICIDNRIELGLLSSIEEQYILNSKDTSEMELIIPYIMKAVRVFEKAESYFFTVELNEIYIKMLDVIYRQLTIMSVVGDLGQPYMMEIKSMIIQNIIKLSALIVDINIIKNIISHCDGNGEKPLVIFVGAAHAYRLHKYFPKIFTTIETKTSRKIMKLLEEFIYENEVLEKRIINILEENK
jgi:hypothetical protein